VAVVGAVALALGIGIPAANALWWDQDSTKETVVQYGQVGFAVDRLTGPDGIRYGTPAPLTARPEGASPPGAFSTWVSDDDWEDPDDQSEGRAAMPQSVAVGSVLSAQLLQDDAIKLLDPNKPDNPKKYPRKHYILYEVTALAEGNARLEYDVSLSGWEVETAAGVLKQSTDVTAHSKATFALLNEAANETCDPDLTLQTSDRVTREFVYTAGKNALTTVDPVTGVDYDEPEGTQLWCLVLTYGGPDKYKNTATIEVGAETFGDDPKVFQDKWHGLVTHSTGVGEQLTVTFTPRVSRWTP
jgi:hypothetical protein